MLSRYLNSATTFKLKFYTLQLQIQSELSLPIYSVVVFSGCEVALHSDQARKLMVPVATLKHYLRSCIAVGLSASISTTHMTTTGVCWSQPYVRCKHKCVRLDPAKARLRWFGQRQFNCVCIDMIYTIALHGDCVQESVSSRHTTCANQSPLCATMNVMRRAPYNW